MLTDASHLSMSDLSELDRKRQPTMSRKARKETILMCERLRAWARRVWSRCTRPSSGPASALP